MNAELPFPRYPWPWRIVDRGDDWAARWGHAGWRYRLVDATGRTVVLGTVRRRSRPVAVTGTTDRQELAAHARRLATADGHNPDDLYLETT